MNKRQAKKEYRKHYQVVATYSGTRKMKRKSHELSIMLARKEHRNYWDTWYWGYPNRARFCPNWKR